MDFDAARRMREIILVAELQRRVILLLCVFPVGIRIYTEIEVGFHQVLNKGGLTGGDLSHNKQCDGRILRQSTLDSADQR